jgi:acetyl-CoA synthetase
VPVPATDATDADRFRAARDFLLAHRTDPATACAGFRWPALTHFNWALDHFERLAREQPGASALEIVGEDGSRFAASYAEMAAQGARVAGWLRTLGLARGDRVLLMLGNEPALWQSMLACIRLGLVMIPATALLSRDDLVDRLERGRVRAVVTGAGNAPRFEGLDAASDGALLKIAVGVAPGTAAPAGWHDFAASIDAAPHVPTPADGPTRADELLLLYFTSGTTSKPKLVQHTHASYPAGHLSTMFWTGLRPGDRHWNISSPGWGKHAWSSFFAPWNAGSTIFMFNQARFDAKRTLDTLVAERITSLCAPPTVWRLLIQERLADWKVHLTEALSAGEPLNAEVIEQVRAAWGVTIRDGYGQTETTAQVGNPPGQPVMPGSMGRPLPGYRVVLLDPQDQPADEGELSLALADTELGRPLGLMPGYADSPEKNAEVMRGGYYRTGDVVRRDPGSGSHGSLTYVGRADDVFKASDYRISPFELESVLIEHPAVAEAAVVPSPDAMKLAVPKAFVVLAPGHAPDEATALDILAFCRAKLAPYKRIRRLEFAELPKTISGKIRRVELRRKEEQRPLPIVPGAGEWFDDALRG